MTDENIRDFLQHDRHDFHHHPLLERDAPVNPMVLFEAWFKKVMDDQLAEPYAFSLATTDDQGMPSLRVVYMRDLLPNGFVFYTNYLSQKGKDLIANRRFSANFFWATHHRQVRFTGNASKIDEATSDAYFNSRPRQSQIGAWASAQSAVINNRTFLEDQTALYEAQFDNQSVPRPPFWGGFALIADKIEFWQGRESRLHDRLLYSRKGELWQIERLSP